jgi:hypothetical protein
MIIVLTIFAVLFILFGVVTLSLNEHDTAPAGFVLIFSGVVMAAIGFLGHVFRG